MRDNFNKPTAKKVAERAGYICSNPNCRRLTIGPVANNSSQSTKTGVAAHICAAASHGPRYDISQTPSQRVSIENAIWLCASCSVLIDKNNGIDYPVNHLRRWKTEHEQLMKECLEGNRRLVLQFQAINSTEYAQCRKIVKFLEQKGVLFQDYGQEIPTHVVDSIKEIRIFLTSIQAEIEPNTNLEIIVDSINHAFRHFMNKTGGSVLPSELEYTLGAVRKIVGINLLEIQKLYSIQVGSPLNQILPN